ncbi:hypothetical protein [Propionivibrio sp.]|uniref:hypothetical protein n=1 Tax=Propionivibrio sp. TaxID=2212460 RepID=UPI0039E22CE5
MKITSSFIVVAAFVVAGCAPMTAREIREQSAPKSFSVGQDYQAAYRSLLEEMRRCFQFGSIGSTWLVQGDLHQDLKKGVIEVTVLSGITTTLLVVDVLDAGSGTARIDVMDKPGQSSSFARVRGFAESGTPMCRR